ncbi:MAG TPA: VCBS repeat-containing protein [Cytophagales bacterium]|nr:VCBS repeat-containing protein [Cytophagales bacterium]
MKCKNYTLFTWLFLILCNPLLAQKHTALFTILPSQQTGVDFKNQIKESEKQNVLSYEYFYNGGGVAIGDVNNDGLQDLYFTANMKPDRLYLNLGNLKFKDITRQAKIKGREKWKTGVSMVDINGDRFLDIYVCYSGNGNEESRRNQLFINNGDLTFSEKSEEFGLDDPSYSTQAAFFDYDKDGDLDMYLLNHNIKDFKDVDLGHLKTEYDSLAGDKLFQNQKGKFIDVSRDAGISGNPISYGLGISISDINNDHLPDIYVSNDYRENDYLYINNGNGTFTDKINESFGHISEFSMGNDIADINNDGLPDLITLDMLPEDNRRQKLLQSAENYELYQSLVKNGFHHQLMRNMLQLNNGDGTFSEIGQLAGVSNTDWSWSPLIADFDNDGNKDLFISNGYLRDYTNKDFLKFWGNYVVEKAVKMEETNLLELIEKMPSTLTKNYIFKNNNDLTFANVTEQWGLNELVLSHGAAYGDLDNDGDVELVLNNVNGMVSIYKNNTSENLSNNFLDVELSTTEKNTAALGTKVTVFADGKVQVLEQFPARGFQSSVTPFLHFGLGTSSIVDSLLILWPDGSEQKMRSVAANQKLLVKKTESNSSPLLKKSPSIGKTYFDSTAASIKFVHQELNFNDFKRQPLMPKMYSHSGPVMTKADVNNDGLTDIFIGAGKGQPSALYVQLPDASFKSVNNYIFEKDISFTASDAEFADFDSDGDLDLLVASGGYGDLQEGNEFLYDRLYLNDGAGNFSGKKNFIKISTSKSCISPVDFDNDGDIDVFMGGSVVPGAYPSAPKSYFLINDGKGNFQDVTDIVSVGLSSIGMVTDAKWQDLDGNGYKDLILTGEWLPISVFMNDGKKLINNTKAFFEESYSGWWNTLWLEDMDVDGDVDIIAGNLGTNTQLKASEKEPMAMVFKDFDGNGSVDPFLCTYIQGKQYPYVTRDELLDQIFSMRKKFTSYKSYADATLEDVFLPEELKNANRIIANTLETSYFENQGGKFVLKKLPVQCQFSPVHSILSIDVNGDKKKDLLLFGNDEYMRLKIGKTDANYGTLLLNKGAGEFEYVPQYKSGLNISGDVKSSMAIKSPKGDLLILGINNQSLKMYIINTAPL